MITSTAPHAHTDAELLDRAEQGDEAAFTALYRRYYGPTRRLAYTYLLQGSPDDLVDATFAEVVDGLRAHRRPADSFGLYLFATLRRLAGAQVGNTPPGVRGEVPGPVVSLAGRPALGGSDRATVAQAFAALGERWQVVIWHTAVDGCDRTALAQRLGVTPTAAEAQARRAGTKLRDAYLAAQLRVAPRPGCHPHRDRLAALRRGALNRLDTEATRSHLDRCDSCRNLVADFDHLEERLAWAVVPLFPFVATLGPASSPLAVGVAGHEVSALAAPESAPLPFRSATSGPRHMAAGSRRSFGRSSSVVTGTSTSAYGPATGAAPAVAAGGASLFGDGDPDDDEAEPRRRPLAAFAAAAAAVVLLVGGLAAATTLLSGGKAEPDGVEVAKSEAEPDVSSVLDPDADADASSTTRAPRTTAGRSSTTAGRSSTTAGRAGSTSTSSSSSSSSTRPSTTGAPSASSSVPPTPSSTPATTAPPATPSTIGILGPAPEVMLEAPTWRVTDTGAGTLTVAVSRASAPAGSTEPPSNTDVALSIDVTNAVRLDGRLDGRCDGRVQGNGTISGVITCMVDAPALGGTESVTLALTVNDDGQQAEVTAEQGGTDLGTDTAELVVDPASTLLSAMSSTLGPSTG